MQWIPLHIVIDVTDIILFVCVFAALVFMLFSKQKNKHDQNNRLYRFWKHFYPKYWDNITVILFWCIVGFLLKEEVGTQALAITFPKASHITIESTSYTLTALNTFVFGFFIPKWFGSYE